MVVLACFWVVLEVLLASLRVLLVALRCLLGLSWLPSGCSGGHLRHPFGAPGCSKTTFKQHSHLKRRFLENAIIFNGLLLFLMPYGWVWELKIVPRKVHRV